MSTLPTPASGIGVSLNVPDSHISLKDLLYSKWFEWGNLSWESAHRPFIQFSAAVPRGYTYICLWILMLDPWLQVIPTKDHHRT